MKNKISPAEFLQFAREDLEQGDKRGLVNAYTNLKRSMHGQIDLLLGHFDLLTKKNIKRMNFPLKFDLIKRMGFVSPKSFKDLNKSRNLLEHESILPNKKELTFGLDLLEFYLENTNKVMLDSIKYSEVHRKRYLG